jgi:D-amino-acid dehydrogenase
VTRRITIIGGGVIGLFSAYECLRRGWQVAVIDRVGQQARNCSYGNAGMVVPSHFIPLAAPGMVQLESAVAVRLSPKAGLGTVAMGMAFLASLEPAACR